MKKLIIILGILGCLSCENDSDSNLEYVFEGSWTWLSSTGGIDGRTETPESTGNNIVVKFSSNKYSKYVNDVLEKELSFTLEEGSSIYSQDLVVLIHYEDGSKQSFVIGNSELILRDECHDCFQSIYIKN